MTLNCPKCRSAMEKVTFEGVEVDRCTACQGIWFDAMEKERLKGLSGSTQVDVGREASRPLAPRVVLCPVCKTPMITMSVMGQPDLEYESCTVCYGAFFDAGEFRAFKGEGVMAKLKGLMGW